MPISNYPNGFAQGVSIRGIPLLNAYGGDIYWVDSGAGSDSGKGTHNQPFKTIDYTIGRCTANNGDIIMVKAGHAETVSAASGIDLDVAGVAIIGLGSGADRPTLTFSATDATMTVAAASSVVKNFLIKPSIDSVVSPIVVSAADCTIDVEVQDATAAIECVGAILTTNAADRLDISLKYRGFLAGDACVVPIRLVGVDTARIYVDFYGVASTSIVEFHTTACHDIVVAGKFYNNGTTLTKNVVDTATGSTWSATGWDGNSNASFSGGDNSALAADDVAAVSGAVATVDGIVDAILVDTDTTIPGLIATAQADLNILTGADGAKLLSGTQASIDAIEIDTSTTLPATLAAGVPQTAIKATGDLTAFGTSKTLFTVTGDVLVKVGASVDVAVTSTSGTTTLEVGVAGNTAALCVQDAVDNTAFAEGDTWTLISAPDTNAGQMADEWVLIGNGVDIILTGSVDDITAGDIDFYCQYLPLSADGAVVAA